MALLKSGAKGEPVRILQEKLGLDADGHFGAGTAKALKTWQSENGLSADGMAGPDTFAHLGLFELILIKTGSKGETVKKVQAALGLDADGIFGGGTEKALRAFQEENGLPADGLVGAQVLAKLGVFRGQTDRATCGRRTIGYRRRWQPCGVPSRALSEADQTGHLFRFCMRSREIYSKTPWKSDFDLNPCLMRLRAALSSKDGSCAYGLQGPRPLATHNSRGFGDKVPIAIYKDVCPLRACAFWR